MKYWVIYQILVDCIISIPYESSTHVISQKHLDEVFDANKHNYVGEKKFVENLCCKPLYQNPFNMFIKKLDEIKEKLPPK